jgi:hypothetical protein
MFRLFILKESSLNGLKRMRIRLIGMKMLNLGGIIKKEMRRMNSYGFRTDIQ